MKMIEWAEDVNAGRILEKNNLKHEMAVIPASMIDVDRSRQNHARARSLLDEVAEDYLDSMKSGDIFPAIVVAKINGVGKYVIAGGNHRHDAGLRLGLTHFTAHVISDCSEAEFSFLGSELNTYVGQREDRKSRVATAASLVLAEKMSAKEAAKIFRVPSGFVNTKVREEKVHDSAKKIGWSTKDFGCEILSLLFPVIADAVLFPAAIKLAKTGCSGRDFRQIMKDVWTKGTEKEREEFIGNAIESRRKVSAGGRIANLPKRARLLSSVTAMESLAMPGATLERLQITKDELGEIIVRLKGVSENLIQIFDEVSE
jgi:hypothetical protein